VVTASENLSTQGWPAAQDRLAALSSDSVHSVARASHAGMLEDPVGAEASTTAITAVVHAVATGAPVATS
jgi:hypothetical protein